MKILVIHRDYRLRGGEEAFLEDTIIPELTRMKTAFELIRLPALFSTGHYLRDGSEIALMALGVERLRPSFFHVNRVLASRGPFTHALFSNFVPGVSLAVPKRLKAAGIRTLWWMHNAKHSCANGLVFNGREECHKCQTRGSIHALTQKCRGSWAQSAFYAWVYRFHRIPRLLKQSMDVFIGSSAYTVSGLRYSLPGVAAHVLRPPPPPPAPSAARTPVRLRYALGTGRKFFAYVGRLSYEKGADRMVDLARAHPEFDFIMAGQGPLGDALRRAAPANLFLVGFASEEERQYLFAHAEALVIPSRVPENAALVVLESHPYKTPVIYPKNGGAEELVKHFGRQGMAFTDFTGQTFKTHTAREGDFEEQFTEAFRNLFDSRSLS